MINEKFFQKHQKLLLRVFNTRLGRWFFKINGNKSSVGERKIIQILPNAITWRSSGRKLTTEFRTHDKFAKRLYYGLYPLWKLLHLWDTLFANVFQPAWNLGFDSLTAYPDAGTGNTTVDSPTWVQSAVGWADAHDAASGSTGVSTALETVFQAYFISGTTYNIYRAGYTLDTSALAGGTVTAAVFSIWLTAKYGSAGSVNIYGWTPTANNSVTGTDYAAFGTTAYATAVGISAITVDQYTDLTFDATGRSNVSTSDITKIGAREASKDVANSAPTDRQGADGYFADQAGTTNDPKLVVTYTPAPGGTLDLTSKIW